MSGKGSATDDEQTVLLQIDSGTAHASSKVGLLGQAPNTGPDEPVTRFTRIPNLPLAGTVAVGLLLPLGALAGALISMLPRFWLDAAFAFGLVALLYLVTEELLVEAHEQPDTPWATAAFFVGFLALLVLEDAL